MNHLENSKSVTKIGTADTTTATTHQHSIDTLGFSYASVDVVFEPVAAAGTNSAVAIALKLQEGDTTASYSDISGFVGGTDFHRADSHAIPQARTLCGSTLTFAVRSDTSTSMRPPTLLASWRATLVSARAKTAWTRHPRRVPVLPSLADLRISSTLAHNGRRDGHG